MILGLDLALANHGIAAVTNATGCNIELLTNQKFKTTGLERLEEARRYFEALAGRYPWDMVVIEDYAMRASGHVVSIGEMGGTVRMVFYRNNIPMCYVSPGTLKKFVTGSGGKGVGKDIMMLEVFKRYGVEAKTSDQADAVGLAMIGHALVNGGNLNAKQRECLSAVKHVPARIARKRQR